MWNFDFTKSGMEFKEGVIPKLRDGIERIIENLRMGKGEYIFSTLFNSTKELKNIKKIGELIKKKFTTLIVVGIGGSSLGAKTLINAFRTEKKDGCKILFLENIDSESITDVLGTINPAKTAINFVSRSGSTLETVSQYLTLKEHFRKKLKVNFHKNFFVTTADANSFLGREARDFNYTLIKIPPELVGRYSVLSPVGLIPAVAMGLNVTNKRNPTEMHE